MTPLLLVVILCAVFYVAHLLNEIRGELRAISSNLHPVDLSGITFSLDAIETNTRDKSDSKDEFGSFHFEEGEGG